MKKAFTIVELLAVITVIGILMTLVFTAASNSVKAGRKTRAQALCQAVQAGLSNYYAHFARWPGSLGTKIENGSIGTRSNNEGTNNRSDDDLYVLDGTEVRQMVKALVDEAKKGNPLMDISALWVSRSPGEPRGTSAAGGKGQQASGASKRAYGMSFMDAIHGTRSSKDKMTSSQMYFGYPDPETGYFLRFKMVYSIPADQISVMMH